MSDTPQAIYVWLVPSEQELEQPGSWRIRKWDTTPFAEATHVAALRGTHPTSCTCDACSTYPFDGPSISDFPQPKE